jgi:hypothetical protein
MKKAASFFALTVGLSVLTAISARADVQIVEKTVIDCPGVRQMLSEIPQDQRASLLKMMSPMITGTPWITTTYVQGNRMRTDMGQTTVVVNADSGKSFTLDRQTHKYSIGMYNPFQKAAGDFSCQITPTAETQTMLGHTVRRYLLTMKSSVLPKSDITGEMWAAPDLPTPPSADYGSGPAGDFGSEMSKVKGMPLGYQILFKNTPAGDIRVVSYATEIDTTTLSASVFKIPDDFQKGTTQTAESVPSTGFPLGDGMPLDGMGPVTDQMATGGGDSPVNTQQMMGGMPTGDMQKMLGSMGGGSGSAAGGLGGMSAADLQKMLGSMGGGSGGGGDALGGMSTADLQKMIAGMTGGSEGLGGGGGADDGGDSGQSMQQLSSELQSLMSQDQ